METIALLGKGGTAKTTSTGSLAHAFARRGKKVVMLDLDSQASLSNWLAGERAGTPMIEDVLLGRNDWPDALVEITDNLTLAPTMNFALREVEDHIDGMKRRSEHLLGDRLAELADVFDYCLIDTPRGLDTEISNNVFECMTRALVATEASQMSLTANREIIAAVREVGEERGLDLLLGTLPTRVDTRTTMSALAIEVMQEEGLRVFPRIRMQARVAELDALKVLLWDLAPNSTAAQDYEAAADEMLAVITGKDVAA